MYIKGISGYLSKYEGTEVDTAVERTQHLDEEFALKVDKTTQINGYSLSGNITLNAEDIGALPDSTKYAKSLSWGNGILYLLDQDGNVLSSRYIKTATTWGSITGTLSDQADLQNALDAKYDASNPDGFISGITSSDVTSALGYIPYNSSNPDGFISGITSSDVTSALGYIPYNSSNPDGFISGITSSDVTEALGFTPYNSTNPAGYISGITSSDVTGALGYTPYDDSNPAGYISGINSTDVVNALGYTPYNSTNPAGYISGITSSDVTTALGYTPYSSTNPDGFISGITSSDVTEALGFTPYNSTNPDGFISGITSSDVTEALGFTPYNSTNPAGYITLAALNGYATEQWVTNQNYVDNSSLTTILSSYATSTDLTTGLAEKQDTIDSQHMLSSDLVDDTGKVHKFATSAQLSQIATNTSSINTINSKIPSEATAQNQLADKEFVNSSIATNTANFIGTFETVSQLKAYTGTVTNNDYAFVTNSVVKYNGGDFPNLSTLLSYDKTNVTNYDYAWVVNGSNFDLYRFDIVNQVWSQKASDISKEDVSLNTAYNRYKASVSGSAVTWTYEYTLNNSSFTAQQWAAINSGITDILVAQISTNQSDISTINSTLNGFGNIVTYNVSEFATASQGALADTALQPNDNISELTNDAGYITGITSSDVTTALGYTPYDSSNPAGYTDNVGTVTSVNNISPVNGNVTLTMPTVDQTYNATSANAQSGVAINGAKFIRNIATGADALTIGGAVSTVNGGVNIGTSSTAGGAGGVAVGWGAEASTFASALGMNAKANGNYSIQLGYGTNLNASTLSVGFNASSAEDRKNWQLLDGTTGLIPDARLSSNIARTSAIPTESTVSSWGFTKNVGTVTSVNNVSPVNGNVTLSIPSIDNLANKDLSNLSSTGNAKFQAPLVSGTNIKTINSTSILGSGNISVATSAQGALADTALQPNDNISELSNDAGYITGITSSDVTTALGYTPYDDSNPDGFISGITSSDVTSALGYIPYNSTNPDGFISGITSSDVTGALGYTPYDDSNPAGYISGINSTDVVNALGYTPYNSTNPAGYISGITSSDVTTALGYTPYDDSNPAGYISSASVSTLTDVTLTSLSDGQILVYDSTNSKWINSAAPNSAVWGNISGTLSDQTDLNTALSGKQPTITGAASTITTSNLTASRVLVSDTNGKVAVSSITSTKLGYLTDVTSNIQAQINGKQPTISDLSDIRDGAALGATALQPNDNISELTNDAGYITGITSSDVTTALGFTPYNSTNPAGYISGITSSDVTTALGYTPYNSSNPAGYISSAALSTLTDVEINNVSDGQHLVYDSTDSKWKNVTSSQVVTWGTITGTLSSQTDLQDALDDKQDSITGAASTITSSNLTTGRALISDTNGKVAVSSITSTKLGYLTDVTSNIQSQLNGKQPTLTSGSNIKTINNTPVLGSGNISVATSAQGALADTALQPNDNISELNNDAGYTTNVGTVTSVNNVQPVNGNVSLTIPTNLQSLSDVAITSPSQGQNLTYDSINNRWINTSTTATIAWGGITGSINDQTDLKNALAGKLDGFTLQFAGNWSGGVHAVNFVTVDYSDCNSENGVFIKFSMVNSHGNGEAGRFLQDVVLNVKYTGTVAGTLYRYFAVPIDQSSSEYYGSHYYGDVFWVNDTTNKIVRFYVLMHQYSYTSQSPYFRLNASTKGVITQATGGAGAPEYSEGTKEWTTVNWFETDQTYSATSTKPQSGVAIDGAKFIRNTAIGSNSLNILGNSTNYAYSTTIGAYSFAPNSNTLAIGISATAKSQNSMAIGPYGTKVESGSNYSIAIGADAEVEANKSHAIQIGYGTNSTSNTLGIGFNGTSYTLLDGTTGLIPDARISSNIARSSDIPTESTVSGWGFTKNTGTVTSVNGVSPVNGNVTIEIPDSATWGNITGTLSNQTDLKNALDGKVNTSDFIAYTAAEVETLWGSIA